MGRELLRCLLATGLCAILVAHSGCKLIERSARKHYDRVSPLRPFDAIIVTGYPFKNGSWGSLVRARVIWSYILYKNGFTKNVIYSGAANYTPYKEAVIMGLYAEQLGIPREHIFYDTLAKHSTENVYYSYLLAREKGFKKVALATDGLQTIFLRGFIRKHFSAPIVSMPILKDSVDMYRHLNPVIDPAPAKVDSFVALGEGQNIFKRIFNPDKHIDWEKYPNEKVPPL